MEYVKRCATMSILALGLTAAAAKKKPEPVPLHEKSFQEIVREYTFVADFNMKAETRPVGDEVFWRYPLSLPSPSFPWVDFPADLPKTDGEGRAMEHLNLGRTQFLDGDVEGARKTWLTLRSRYGNTFSHHRRNDYFIALAFMKAAEAKLAQGGESNLREAKVLFGNAATFLAYAFQIKKDLADPYLDNLMPQGFYNLATIYFYFERYAGAFGIASEGLDYLRKTGRKEFRTPMRRLLAESFIQNRSYLEAVQELDLAIRESDDPLQVAAVFARVGDIYFDLNNFDLAEEAYALANQIGRQQSVLQPAQFVARGESLFWLGRFAEAQQMFFYALQGRAMKQAVRDLTRDEAALASMRIADAYLAQKVFEKARLAYFEQARTYPQHITAIYASIRLACLELPEYKGNNVAHARETLLALRQTSLIAPAREMAWACEVASYAQRERNDAMVARVRLFSDAYPHSRFLKGLIGPVTEVQAVKIWDYVKKRDPYGTVLFYENNAKVLYQKPDKELALALFRAYADIGQAEKARAWLGAMQGRENDDWDLLRMLAVTAEDPKPDAKAKARAKHITGLAEKRPWQIKRSPAVETYVERSLASPQRRDHFLWTLRLYQLWQKKEPSLFCSHVFPLAARFAEIDPQAAGKAEVMKTMLANIDTRLKDIVTKDKSCAYALVDFEARNLSDRPQEMVTKILAREWMPVDAGTAKTYFSVAESLRKAGRQDAADEIYKIIRDKGDASLPEVKYAKIRLDKSKSEWENLWDSPGG